MSQRSEERVMEGGTRLLGAECLFWSFGAGENMG